MKKGDQEMVALKRNNYQEYLLNSNYFTIV